jgi:asparagine synthase (glutamine-hydrolysing)
MCGFTGIYAFNELGRFFSINTHQSNEALAHRGPDAARLFNDYYVALGHRRLSVIDLTSDGHQPMTDPTGRYTLVFNGEIYNYRALRGELMARGVQFHSQSDTEVLLQSFIAEGKDCLHKLQGFFAFAVYDQQENTLFLARDRYGIKPLVYYLDEDKLLFASEIKALLAYRIKPEIDHTALFQYFLLNYIPAPHTAFKNIFKLMPGHYLTLKDRQVTIDRYYQVPYVETGQGNPTDYATAGKKLIGLLETSVADRMVADVPLGAFLSGGIDSSTVVALASQQTPHLNTFSIGFRNEPLFDETHYALQVAEQYKTNHHVFKLHTDDYFEEIFQVLDHFGEPFADSSSIPFYFLCKQTRKKVTVALSGDGADELFAGYHKHHGLFQAANPGMAAHLLKNTLPLWKRLPKSRNTAWGNQFRRLYKFSQAMNLSLPERYWYLCGLVTEQEARGFFSPAWLEKIDWHAFGQRKNDLLRPLGHGDMNEMLLSDVEMLLPNDMLHKVDAMSMAHALEVRVPFLDYRVVNFAFTLPASYKIDHHMKKKVLQDAARHLLPKSLYKRPKQGFDVPLARGYRNQLRNWIDQEAFDEDFIREQQVFDPAYIRNLWQKVQFSNDFDQHQVWGILAFQYWWKKFVAGRN